MGNITKFINGLMVTFAIVVGSYIYFFGDPGLPELFQKDHYWGAKQWKLGDSIPADNTQVKKFVINVPEADLVDLKSRLQKTRITESFKGVNFEYGFPSDSLKKVIAHWTGPFNWRKQEKILNQYSHFKTQIEGLDVHFIHVKPSKPATQTLPLLLVHGWPGSVWEFYKIIPMLTEPVNGVAFELVIPSIPGYAWSEAAHKPGFNLIHSARIFGKLMKRLGHDKYYYHGGDWGSMIGKALATLSPQHVLGYHTTMPVAKVTPYSMLKMAIGAFLPSLIYDNPEVDSRKLYPVLDKMGTILREMGYLHLQATKPDTAGVGLSDSPSGLAAYILEKFSFWVKNEYINRPDGGLTEKFTYDELLTNVMIYWTTNSITSSMRFYKENIGQHVYGDLQFDRVAVPLEVPVGIAAFPDELLVLPKSLLPEVYYNITQYTDMPRGGHFASFEEPKLVADDIRSFIRSIGTKRRGT